MAATRSGYHEHHHDSCSIADISVKLTPLGYLLATMLTAWSLDIARIWCPMAEYFLEYWFSCCWVSPLVRKAFPIQAEHGDHSHADQERDPANIYLLILSRRAS